MKYTIGLAPNGTTPAYVTVGGSISIAVSQFTPGPFSYVNVSFGDGSPMQNCTVTVSAKCTLNNTYTTAGTFTIQGTAVPFESNATTSVNNMTVVVIDTFAYKGILLLITFP
jgi:hypothetical protein